MIDLFGSGISIEKYAAFLDGNLSDEEMSHISIIINSDDNMNRFAKICNQIDDTISGYTENDIQFPLNLQTSEFKLPVIDEVAGYTYSHPCFSELEDVSDMCCNEVEIDNSVSDDKYFGDSDDDSLITNNKSCFDIEDTIELSDLF